MQALSKPLWSFAVIADTHVEPDPNAPSNLRLAAVIEALNRQRPDLVLHLGDIVHPLPGGLSAEAAWRCASELLGRLAAPLHATPGNHDIGDKPMAGMPAAKVNPDWRRAWVARQGSDNAFVDHGDCRFLLLNSPTLNSDAAAAEQLSAFLGRARLESGGRRLVLLTHYPLYLESAGEPDHYDNIGEPARGVLLDFCREAGVEAVFTGHIHNYLYRASGGTRHYGAPSVAFLRRDFSEMFQVPPLAEFGREDPCKTGFFWVDVHASELVVRMISTEDTAAFAEVGLMPGQSNRDPPLPLGVNLRHDWVKVTELPLDPPVGAFVRRRVRDDHTLRLLLELGLRDLRIPAADLLEPDKVRRLAEMHELGLRFCLFFVGPPPPALLQALGERGQSISALELITAPGELQAALSTVAPVAAGSGFALWHGALFHPASPAGKATHRINHGYDVACGSEAVNAIEALAATRSAGVRTGLMFASPLHAFNEDDAVRLAAFAAEHEVDVPVLLERRADDTVALADDRVLPLRVKSALEVARRHRSVRLFLDTFMEVDRGYHVRTGLVDRRMNPTPAGRVLRAANSGRREPAA